MQLLRDPSSATADLSGVTLGDLPDDAAEALRRRRRDLGLSTGDADPVLVDDAGLPIPPEQAPLRLRMATSVRISMEGNSHFCRGLLATRYADGDSGGITTVITDSRRAS